MYVSFFKRVTDLFLSLLVLFVLLPFILLTALLLLCQNKGTPFFFQMRPGYKQRPFYIIKFKTMTDVKDDKGNLLPDNQRITNLGRVVRKMSIDELPQLINVLKGEMSLVGPRPLLFKYIHLYSEKQLRRHEVKPGITGWAQVNGRNSISWEQKLRLDVEYVDNLSLALDVKILWMTLKKVLVREGVNQSDARPMEPFNGNN